MKAMLENKDALPEYCSKRAVILGCGNILLGDDGFGPEVVKCLSDKNTVPGDVALLDAGTGVVDILFNIALSEIKPQQIILVDAMTRGLPPGKLSVLTSDLLGEKELRTHSQHHVPASKMLRELHEIGGVNVTILTVEPENIPDEIQPGLSDNVKEAVIKASELIGVVLKTETG